MEVFPHSYFPDVQRLQPLAAQDVHRSPYNGAQQVINFAGGELWMLELTFADLAGDVRAELTAFFTRVRVSRNEFLILNHTAPQRGALSGSAPLVAVESQTGAVLILSTSTSSVANWILQGDFLTVNSELKMCLNDVTTTGAGVASCDIWPPLRTVPDSGTEVEVSSPVGLFRMLRPVIYNTTPPGYRTDISVSAIEAINSSMVVDL